MENASPAKIYLTLNTTNSSRLRPRHGLLRLLLSKMIAPIGLRYPEMSSVIRDIEQIENWERTIGNGPLDPKELTVVGQLQKQMAEKNRLRINDGERYQLHQ